MRRVASSICLFLIALAGCAGEPQIYSIVQDRAYSPSEFRHAAANKAFRTIIAGNPFDKTPTHKVHDAVLAAMQPANWYQSLPFTPKTYFTDTPKGEHNPRYHVVVALNPDDADGDWAAAPCADDIVPQTLGPRDEYTVRMVFCRDGVPLSISHGALEAPAKSDGARYRGMITRVTMELFPQRRDNRDCRSSLRGQNRC